MRDAHHAIDHVKHHLVAEHGIGVLQLGRRHQRNELVQRDEESHRENNVQRRDPSADLGLLAILVRRNLVQRHIGRIAQRAEAQHHSLSQRHDAANHRPSHPLMLLRKPLQRLRMRRNRAIRLAHRDTPGMRRAHHHALQHGLPADQGLLAAFQRRQELDSSHETKVLAQFSHSDWMFLGSQRRIHRQY